MFKVVFLLYFFISSIFASEVIYVGVLYHKLFVSKKDANIGVSLWHKQMEKRESEIAMKLVLYEDEKILLEDYKNKKLSHIVSDSTFYYENKKLLDELSSDKWIMNQSENMFEELYLIKNIDSNFNFKNFNASRIYYQTESQRVWIEKLIYENSKNPNKILKKLVRVKKTNRLMFNVFFEKDDISIVSKDFYDSMYDLNPQIEEKIDIIKKSEKIFFSGMGFIRKELGQKVQKELDEMEKQFASNPRSFDVLSFTNIQKIYFVDDESKMKGINKFYDEFFKLRGKK